MTKTQELPQGAPTDPDDASKDQFFARVAEISEEMIAAHGKDFAMGTLVLAARWIAGDKISAGDARH